METKYFTEESVAAGEEKFKIGDSVRAANQVSFCGLVMHEKDEILKVDEKNLPYFICCHFDYEVI